ncbi:MAG TPA: CCA tRNA nucleotidyltransferase [Chthoniobacterales bacterium]|nr:CCA tRNA nucleotidyltransferase [Chthoniobacterales bacterium]
MPKLLNSSPLVEGAISVVRRLHGHGHVAYFAGGCVRDALLGFRPKDIDVATDARPEEVQRLFARTVPVGAKFGVIRVLENEHEFEVATFRSDGNYLDGRRPETVSFSSAEEDARRRDFTINGMFYDPIVDTVVDYVGGREDLEKKLIRAIGEAKLRFGEDRLRMLRAVRFAAVLGFQIDKETWNALRTDASQIKVVSPERIRDELMKILADAHRVRGLDLLDASGLLEQILPEVTALKGCEQPAEFHPEGDVYVHTRKMLEFLSPDASPLLALMVLLHDIGKPPTQTCDPAEGRIRFNGHDEVGASMSIAAMERLRFSSDEIETVASAVRSHMMFKDVPKMRPAKLRRFMAREHFGLELELHRVDCLSSHGDLENFEFLLQKEKEFESEPLIPPPLVNGYDLIALGLTPGPRFGEILEKVQTAQLEGEIHSRDEALALVRKLVEGSESGK